VFFVSKPHVVVKFCQKERIRMRKQNRQGWCVAVLAAFTLLLAGGQVYAAPPGSPAVGFNSEAGVDLHNAVTKILTLTVSAPRAGYVVLTGSGNVMFFPDLSVTPPNGGWALMAVGSTATDAPLPAEAYLQIPPPAIAAYGGVYLPFSVTTVIPVRGGSNTFYMSGERDSNEFYDKSYWSTSNLKLTAIFVEKLM
jgi:hypothetical protein